MQRLTGSNERSYVDRKLRCPRNSLHLHLFFSFMIRSAVYLLKSTFFSFSSSEMLFSSAIDDALNITITPTHLNDVSGTTGNTVLLESKVSPADNVSSEPIRTMLLVFGEMEEPDHLLILLSGGQQEI